MRLFSVNSGLSLLYGWETDRKRQPQITLLITEYFSFGFLLLIFSLSLSFPWEAFGEQMNERNSGKVPKGMLSYARPQHSKPRRMKGLYALQTLINLTKTLFINTKYLILCLRLFEEIPRTT
jgi:hypothetical protein